MAERLSDPPDRAALQALGPELHILPAGTRIGRIFYRGGEHPATWNGFRYWGPHTSRFDHHLRDADGEPHVQSRGVMYGAAETGAHNPLTTCVAEIFQTARTVDVTGNDPWFTVFATQRDLHLLDLTGLWVTRAGGNAALSSGERVRARAWSRAFYDAYPDIDGLWFPSSIAVGAPSLTLYERAETAMPTSPLFHRALADPTMTRPLLIAAQALGFALV